MKKILTVLLFAAISFAGFAQQEDNVQPDGSRLEALKIATDQEAKILPR